VALRAGDRALRAGDPAGVHPTRVGARRARSTLRTFAPLFPPGPRQAADSSLQAYAARLGAVRDLQVLRGVLAEHTSGQLAEWVDEALAGDLQAGWQRLERELGDPAHQRVPGQLEALLLSQPGNGVDLARCVRRARRKAEKRLAAAGEDAAELHRARKAAKRARYAAEATGKPKQVARFQRLQDLLGTHHDLVVAAHWLDGAEVPAGLRAEARALGVHLLQVADDARCAAVL
jgi:CHAD domain-containing protein